MADSKLAPSLWETLLQSNAVSHWLGANLESAQLSIAQHEWWLLKLLLHMYRSVDFQNPCRFNGEWYKKQSKQIPQTNSAHVGVIMVSLEYTWIRNLSSKCRHKSSYCNIHFTSNNCGIMFVCVNTLKLEQTSPQFPEDIFYCIFFYEKYYLIIQNLLKSVPCCPTGKWHWLKGNMHQAITWICDDPFHIYITCL